MSSVLPSPGHQLTIPAGAGVHAHFPEVPAPAIAATSPAERARPKTSTSSISPLKKFALAGSAQARVELLPPIVSKPQVRLIVPNTSFLAHPACRPST